MVLILLFFSFSVQAQMNTFDYKDSIFAHEVNENFSYLKELANTSDPIPFVFEPGDPIDLVKWNENIKHLAEGREEDSFILNDNKISSYNVNESFSLLKDFIDINNFDYICEKVNLKVYRADSYRENYPSSGAYLYNKAAGTYWTNGAFSLNVRENGVLLYTGSPGYTTVYSNGWTIIRGNYVEKSSGLFTTRYYSFRMYRDISECNTSDFDEFDRYLCYPKNYSHGYDSEYSVESFATNSICDGLKNDELKIDSSGLNLSFKKYSENPSGWRELGDNIFLSDGEDLTPFGLNTGSILND